jgi:hypothetical protein
MQTSAFLHRPIYGGVFGRGRYALATLPTLDRGLHALQYLVIEPGPGVVLSVATDKVAALASARKLLEATQLLVQAEASARGAGDNQQELWPMEAFDQPPIRDVVLAPVSRRRREIFEKSGGKCHYCSRPLTLDGKWHIEHAFPRALGGLDEISNLFAACVPCNLTKRDRTALEFVAQNLGGEVR